MLDFIFNSPFASVAPPASLYTCFRTMEYHQYINSQNRKCRCSSFGAQHAGYSCPTTVILINASRIIKWRRKPSMKITLKMRWPRMCQDRRDGIAIEWKKKFFINSKIDRSKQQKRKRRKKHSGANSVRFTCRFWSHWKPARRARTQHRLYEPFVSRFHKLLALLRCRALCNKQAQFYHLHRFIIIIFICCGAIGLFLDIDKI